MAAKWKIEGDYFETCNCEAACPCVFLSPPTTGDCTVIVAWHIRSGNLAQLKLDGLNAVLAVHSPGHMAQVKWKAALYLDSKATPEQRDALAQIFSGQAGGHFAILANHIGEVVGVKSTPIEFRSSGKTRGLKIDGVTEAEVEAIAGQGDGEVKVSGVPLCIVPGEPSVVARSKNFTYHDHGYSWDLSNKNAFYSPFTYQGT